MDWTDTADRIDTMLAHKPPDRSDLNRAILRYLEIARDSLLKGEYQYVLLVLDNISRQIRERK